MLDPAFYHADRLNQRFRETVFRDRFKFYSRSSFIEYFIPIYQNSDEMIQMVSLDNGDVVGYFSVKINRETNAAYELQVIKFDSKSKEFTGDLHDFFVSLYKKFGVNKITFFVIVGNPAEAVYDNVVTSYGGRIVGIFKKDAKLYDGQLYDVKFYEIMKEEFDLTGVDRFSWRDFRTGV